MNGGSCTRIETAEDIAKVPGEFLKLTARAALAAGYMVDLRNIRYENMIYAGGVHFHPFSNWGQCVRLLVDTRQIFEIKRCGAVHVYYYPAPPCAPVEEYRTPVSDVDYRVQMCDAVVRNVAKGFPV